MSVFEDSLMLSALLELCSSTGVVHREWLFDKVGRLDKKDQAGFLWLCYGLLHNRLRV